MTQTGHFTVNDGIGADSSVGTRTSFSAVHAYPMGLVLWKIFLKYYGTYVKIPDTLLRISTANQTFQLI